MSQVFTACIRQYFLVRAAAMGLLLALPLSAQQSQVSPPTQSSPSSPSTQQQGTRAPDPHLAEEKAAEAQALGFLGALDHGRYDTAYAYTSSLLRSKADRAQFAAEVKKDRETAGAMQSRRLIDASYTTNLPGAPAGQYVVLQYGTVFAQKPQGVETVTLSYERQYWRVAGWFLK